MFSHLPRPAWLMAFGHVMLELCNNFLPVVYPLFITSMGLTYTQVGLVALIAGISGTLTQPFFGYLSDRWGSRRLTVLSIAWTGLTMGLIGFSPDYPSLILLVTLGALGSAAFHPAGATIALTSGNGNRRGTSASVFSVSGNLGTALSPLLITIGLSWVGLASTAILIPLALLFSLLLYRQLERAKYLARVHPAKFSPQSADNPRPKIRNDVLLGLVLIVMAVMARTWFQVTLMTYLPEWIKSEGNSLALGGRMLSVMLVSIGIGSLSGGTLSDYLGRWQVFAISLTLLAPMYWLFLMTSGPVQVVLVVVIGILLGASFPVGLVMAQDAWPSRVGLATALIMGLGWATGGIGAMATGFIADQFSLTVGLQSLILAPLLGVGSVLLYVLFQKRHSPDVSPAAVTVSETVEYSE